MKDTIAKNYLDYQKDKHDWKERPKEIRIMITGDKRKGSIGENIIDNLQKNVHSITSYEGDVTGLLTIPMSNIDTLIMCHGETHLDWIENYPIHKIFSVISNNFFGTINIVQSFIRDTINNDVRKRIIYIGSMAYNKVLNGSSVYCAAKAGATHFMKCMAWELAPKGYDVFIIHPSNVDGTPMANDTIEGLMRYRNLTREQAEEYWGAGYIRQTSLTKEEIADLVRYIVTSPHSAYLSGCNLELAGGQR